MQITHHAEPVANNNLTMVSRRHPVGIDAQERDSRPLPGLILSGVALAGIWGYFTKELLQDWCGRIRGKQEVCVSSGRASSSSIEVRLCRYAAFKHVFTCRLCK